MEIVEVIWEDAACEHANLELEQAKSIRPMSRRSVGYLLINDADRVNLCFGIINDKDKGAEAMEDTLTIPKSIIKEIIKLKGGNH